MTIDSGNATLTALAGVMVPDPELYPMSFAGGLGWYVCRTNPNCEQRARGGLEGKKYEVFLPLYRKRRSHARKVDIVPSALFPRYLFVRLDGDFNLYPLEPIRQTDGIERIITGTCAGNARLPLRIPDGIIADIRDRVERGEHDKINGHAVSRHDLKPGQKVEIAGGALGRMELTANVMSPKPHERLDVFMQILGSLRPVSIPAVHVRPA